MVNHRNSHTFGGATSVAATQGVQGLAGMILGDHLALEIGAMAAMASRHGLPSTESSLPVNSTRSICPPGGAHSNFGLILLKKLPVVACFGRLSL